MRKTVLHRRTVLRGAVGGLATSIALPPLDAMFDANGAAYADGTKVAKRFGLWWWAQGVTMKEWFPQPGSPKPWTQGGKTVGTYDDAWIAGSELQPFVAKGLKGDISVLTGARLFGWSETMHDSQMIGLTTGWPVTQCGGFCVTPSHRPITQELSERWRPSGNRFPILAVTVGSGNISGVPAEKSPSALFDRVFGGTTTQIKTGAAGPRFSAASRKSVLDLVLTDATSVRNRVGASDRARIDAHLQSIRDLETRLTQAPAQGTTTTTMTLTRPTEPAANDYTARHDAFARLLSVAIATGQTRVFSVTMDSGQSGVVYSALGAKQGLHAITHPPSDDPVAKQASADMLHNIVVWRMERLATLVSYLKQIPEGAGTVLDNCLLFASTEMDNPFTHSAIHQPMVFAGKAGGSFKTGRYYSAWYGGGKDFPYSYGGGPNGSTNQESSSKALLTILQALGEADTDYGGDGTTAGGKNMNYGHVTAPFGALLT